MYKIITASDIEKAIGIPVAFFMRDLVGVCLAFFLIYLHPLIIRLLQAFNTFAAFLAKVVVGLRFIFVGWSNFAQACSLI